MPYGSDAVRLRAFKAEFGSNRVAAAPATLYFALLRQATGGTEGTVLGTEPDATGSYARVAMANDDSHWTFGAKGGTNTSEIRWPAASGVWSITAVLNQWAVYDNNSGGNLIAFGALSSTITITGVGDEAVIPAGSLALNIGT